MAAAVVCAVSAQAQVKTPVNVKPGEARDLTYFLERIRTIDHLPELEDSHTAMQSTWDRTGGNADGGDFKNLHGGQNILLDVDGPGCIHRIFTGVLGGEVAGTKIQVFLDNNSTPIFDETVDQFFDDKAGPFTYPLVFHKTYPGLLMPIPFARHCRVQLVSADPKPKWGNYWQVVYTTYGKETKVVSLHWPLNDSEKKAIDAVCKTWLAAESTPPTPPPAWSVERTLAIAPGKSEKVELDGCGVIREMRMSVAPNTPEVLRGLRLRMTWDGAASPSVDVPLGYFFGNADCGNDPDTRFNSLLLGLTPTEVYSRFPMPFAKGATLELVNDSPVAISGVVVHVAVESRVSLPSDWGRFHATWNEERMFGDDFKKLQRYQNVPVHSVLERTDGPGKYVGVMLHVHWPLSKLWWGEGDWMIWTDEDAWPPSYHGTGSEEYFNSGWCQFDRKAVSGYVVQDWSHPVDATVYSFHLNDAFQFQKNVRVAVEIMLWQAPPIPGALWGSTAFWYARDASPANSRPDLVPRSELTFPSAAAPH
jgi:hypothetical protein